MSTAEESEAAEGRTAAGEAAPSRRGLVMEVLRKLLVEGGTEESVAEAVLALVGKLVARNSELEQRLARAASVTRKNEGLSAAQLLLMLDELTESKDAELAKADAGLKHASGVEKWLETAETAHVRVSNSIRLEPGQVEAFVAATSRGCRMV